jgi:hypothetical protein
MSPSRGLVGGPVGPQADARSRLNTLTRTRNCTCYQTQTQGLSICRGPMLTLNLYVTRNRPRTGLGGMRLDILVVRCETRTEASWAMTVPTVHISH